METKNPQLGLIGHPLGHSYSPQIHQNLYPYLYQLFDIPEEQLFHFLKEEDFIGYNVTIPYKEKVIQYLDIIDPVTKKIGAVNTVIKRNNQTYGYNTDILGFQELLNHYQIDLTNQRVLICGTGGTKKTISYVVSQYTNQLFYATRSATDSNNNTYNYHDLEMISEKIDFIINTTPIGMSPNIKDSPVDLRIFKNLLGVIDVIFNPLHTKLLLDAKSLHIPYYNGLMMLVFQAAYASEKFFNTKYQKEEVMKVYQKILFQTSSLMLIGMPASGKSTIGRVLAKKLHLDFLDLDDEITRIYQKTPQEIIDEEGVENFRKKESETLKKYQNAKGLIISSGGGIVTIPANYEVVKHNFLLVQVKRKPKAKSLNKSRPLTSNLDKWNEVYQMRKDLYNQWADITLDVCETPDQTADAIIKKILEK